MPDKAIIYGSTTGNTEAAAQKLATLLGAPCIPIAGAKAADFEAPLLILGSSTWGSGELQDDWASGIALLDTLDLTGKRVALFGTGDQATFSDTFVDAIGILCDKALSRGAILIGQTSPEGYTFTASRALRYDHLCGLALDDSEPPAAAHARLAAWAATLK